ncbi:MAG: DUF6898 family protein [Hyphomicrobiales bacterium]
MRRNRQTSRSREIYFEHIAIGKAVKVSAIDAASGTEVSIAGSRYASQEELERVALQKLLRAMSKKKGR